MLKKIRIACVQANPTVGDLQGNLDIVRRYRTEFQGKADLLVFTECFVSGYPLGDLVLRPGFLRDVRIAVSDFSREIEGSDGPAVLIGAPREGASRPYNSAFLIDTDGSVQITDKCRLPNEEVYDEKRTFAEGALPKPLSFRGFKLGVPICEDFWHGDVNRALVEEGAEALIVPNGSHFKLGKQDKRLDLGHDAARRLGVPVIYVNQIGGQDELAFDGGSFAVDGSAGSRAHLGFDEGSFLVDLVRAETGVKIVVTLADMPVNEVVPSYPQTWQEAVWRAVTTICADYVRKTGYGDKGVVIGMSGGLDSAVTAAMAVDALGPDKVLLVRMPYIYTDSESMEDAEEAARLLGCRIVTIPIGPMVEALKAAMAPLFEAEGRTEPDTTEENFQARVRAQVLMGISNKLGYMVLTTGNKSEMSVGFATLYGDMCGGLSLIKDLLKTKVKRVARWRNQVCPRGMLGPRGTVIPDRIIRKKPSAQLAENQVDENVLGPYEHLDPLLEHMIDGMNTPERAASLATPDARALLVEEASFIEDETERKTAIEAANKVVITEEYARSIARKVRNAQYKRRQAPPGAVLTGRDFGLGWRFPIAGIYGL